MRHCQPQLYVHEDCGNRESRDLEREFSQGFSEYSSSPGKLSLNTTRAGPYKFRGFDAFDVPAPLTLILAVLFRL